MDELINVNLTLEEGRVLLSLAIAALRGTSLPMDSNARCVAANSAAAKLQNRIAACACDPESCQPQGKVKP